MCWGIVPARLFIWFNVKYIGSVGPLGKCKTSMAGLFWPLQRGLESYKKLYLNYNTGTSIRKMMLLFKCFSPETGTCDGLTKWIVVISGYLGFMSPIFGNFGAQVSEKSLYDRHNVIKKIPMRLLYLWNGKRYQNFCRMKISLKSNFKGGPKQRRPKYASYWHIFTKIGCLFTMLMFHKRIYSTSVPHNSGHYNDRSKIVAETQRLNIL